MYIYPNEALIMWENSVGTAMRRWAVNVSKDSVKVYPTKHTSAMLTIRYKPIGQRNLATGYVMNADVPKLVLMDTLSKEILHAGQIYTVLKLRRRTTLHRSSGDMYAWLPSDTEILIQGQSAGLSNPHFMSIRFYRLPGEKEFKAADPGQSFGWINTGIREFDARYQWTVRHKYNSLV